MAHPSRSDAVSSSAAHGIVIMTMTIVVIHMTSIYWLLVIHGVVQRRSRLDPYPVVVVLTVTSRSQPARP